jgi:WD40 repeat protein
MRKFGLLFFSVFLVSMLSLYNTAAQNETLTSLPGQIAYIGVDGNVYVFNPHDNQTESLTTNASTGIHYQWPTWSTDGRLAYFLTKATEQNIETDIYVSSAAGSDGQMVYSGQNEAFTYAYWSPQNCDKGAGCRELAVLLNNLIDRDFSVKLIRNGDVESKDNLAGTGAPFYYSWSPDGGKMLWQRNNMSIDIYDANKNELVDTLPQQPGAFQAPAWSPTDDRLLFGALGTDRSSTDLVIVGSDKTQTLASQLSGPVAFSWSPDGQYVAYVENGGVLFVLNAQSGETVSRSSVSGVYAFFWSPDSKQIAYITLATPPDSLNAYNEGGAKSAAIVQSAPGIAWSVMEASSGATRRYGAFFPTQEMVYLLTFFDQFSQSHRIWSPDSRYLIYGEITSDSHQHISLLDTSHTDTVPFSIEEGVIGIWSFS